MSAWSRRRFAELMRSGEPDLGLACALLAVEAYADLDPDACVATLDALAAGLGAVPAEDPVGAAVALRRGLGDDAGFRGYGDDYSDLRASLLPEVLHRRRGLPILLSVVYLEVARRLSVHATGVGLPGHFVVAIGTGPDPVLVDPFYGGRLVSRAELAARLSGVTGRPVELADDDVEAWSTQAIVTRVLANIRAASAGHDRLRTRLWAVELSMLVPSHAVVLRRERGEILIQLGDYVGAAVELEEYASVVAHVDSAAADHALRAARMSRARLS